VPEVLPVLLFLTLLLLLLLLLFVTLQLIVATGKARGPWVPEVLPRLGLTLPGVFLQGLLITDAEGNVLHSRWGAGGLQRCWPLVIKSSRLLLLL
jgi:hypothetical protein